MGYFSLFSYIILSCKVQICGPVQKSKSDTTMSMFEIVETALKANDLVSLITKINTDLLKQLEASNMMSVEELLAAIIKDDKFNLARNLASECYVPNLARQQEKCTAIR